MENRDHQGIIRDILAAGLEQTGGLKASRFMEHVNLTSRQARAYLTELLEKGMMSHDGVTNTYHTTPKGARYLAAVKDLSDTLYRGFP